MELLESFSQEQKRKDKIAEMRQLKNSLQYQLTQARNEQAELKRSIEELIQSGLRTDSGQLTPQKELRDTLAGYKWLGVSIKSYEDNLQIQFNPAFRGQLPSEHYILEVEMRKDSWSIVQHSLLPFIPVERLQQENEGDIKACISALSDYLFAYVHRRETVSLVKSHFNKFLSCDIETDLPVTFVQIELSVPQQEAEAKIIEIKLQYDLTKTQPDNVEIKADVSDKRLRSWKQWLLKSDINDGLTDIIEDRMK